MNLGETINLFHLYIKGPVPYYKKPWKKIGDAEGCVPDRGIQILIQIQLLHEKKHLEFAKNRNNEIMTLEK